MNKTPSTITLLDRGCEFNGKLSFEGIVRIDGVFQGEIYSQDHLIIGDGAIVEGNIQIGQIEIGGSFKGTIIARDKIVIHGSGRVQGSIQTRELEVHKGGVVDGQIDMTSLREAIQSPHEAPLQFAPFRGNLPA